MKSQGYTALVNVGQQGLNYAVQSAVTVSLLLSPISLLVLYVCVLRVCRLHELIQLIYSSIEMI